MGPRNGMDAAEKRKSLVGFEVLTAVLMKSLCFSPSFKMVLFSAYSTMKMEAICFSETSVEFERTTLRCVPEDSSLQKISFPGCPACSLVTIVSELSRHVYTIYTYIVTCESAVAQSV
jgi:hypothetical protein